MLPCSPAGELRTHLGSGSAHVSHHSPRHSSLKDVGGCEVEHLFQSHLDQTTRVSHNKGGMQLNKNRITAEQYLKDVQRALCEDGAEGGRQAELHQTL